MPAKIRQYERDYEVWLARYGVSRKVNTNHKGAQAEEENVA